MVDQAGVPDIVSKDIQRGTATTSEYLPLIPGQTVCTIKNEKGQKCTGHVKQWLTAPDEVQEKAVPGNAIHRCQRCNAIYEGPPQEYLHPTIKK